MAVLQINPLFAANPGVSAFWFAVHLTKQTWFSNTTHVVKA